MRAEVADARLYVELAIRSDRHQAVVADRAGSVLPYCDTDPAHFRPVARAGASLALLPFEQLGATIERLFDERARHVAARAARIGRAVQRLALRRVDPPDRDRIDSEFLGRLRHHWIHD